MKKETRELIEKSMNEDKGFIKNNNYKLIELEDDCCVIEGNISSSSLNPFDVAHGGYIFGLADTCGGTLAATVGREAVTTSATISYLRKVTGKKIIAKARFLKVGFSISNVEVDIYDDNDNIVSVAMMEYFYINK